MMVNVQTALPVEPMLNSRVANEIARANKFGDETQGLVVARGEFPSGERNVFLMAYWSLAFEDHRGVLCLLHHKFTGPAFALIRPIVEVIIRAHVAIMGSDDDIQRLRLDEYRTPFKTIGQDIDKYFRTGTLFAGFLQNAREALHSFTHAGMLQLGRRFSGNDLLPTYSEEDIIQVIRISTSAIFIVNNLVTKHFGWEADWQRNTQLYAEWANIE